ncbi:MAG: glycosyltransferase family 4 protein [Micavibrio sp.]|nr:glycosyltransferase family 4 protein [Micavibrio sp.]
MSNSKGKILYVINHIDWFWSHRLPLAKGAHEAGWEVHVAVTGAQTDKDLASQNFHGHELPPSDKGFTLFTILKTISEIRKIIKDQRPEVVHAITLKYAFITGLAALGIRDIRVVHTIAGLGYLFAGEGAKPKILRAIIGPLLKLALKSGRTELVFQNPDDMNLMLRRGFAEKSRAHLILGSGVDLKKFTATPLPQDEQPIVLMSTRLVHCKGISVFIEAAKICERDGVKARFQVAGGETRNNPLAINAQEMMEMIKGSKVEWLGKVSDMPELLKNASLICYPSYYGEGIPKVLLEACASARPIITTDHPGCREAVDDGENGVLVPIKDAQKTAEAIKNLLSDPVKLSAYGIAGRARCEHEFDVNIIVKKTLEVYN